jgi:biotin carboxyl carrier protein
MSSRYVATLEGADHELEVEELAANSLRLKFAGSQFDVDVRQIGRASFSVLIGNRSFDLDVVNEHDEIVVASRGSATRVTLIDTARRAPRAAAARAQLAGRVEMKAMMPGRVVSVLVKPGDEVAAQQGVAIVEAMKMENELKSPKAGKVLEVKVAAGQTVEKGELLIIIE